MNTQYQFKSLGPSFGSRALGEKIRKRLKPEIEQSDGFIFDLEDVRVVSYSFADEFFGKLSLELGDKYAKTKIKNASPFVEHIIKVAIRRRQSVGL